MVQIPRLREWREARALTQVELAECAGVSSRSVAGYEAGAGARPPTVRKLAEALGVDPPVLMAEGEKPVSSVPSEDRETQLQLEAIKGLIQLAPEILGRANAVAPEAETISKRTEVHRKEQALARKERYERAREWIERFVSGGSVGFGDSVPEEHRASIRSRREDRKLRYELLPILVSYPEDLYIARSRLASNDPIDTIEAARLVLRRARRIVEEYDSYLRSFHRIPDHYYEDPAAQSRIQKLQETLSQRRVEAAEAVQELVGLYDECLDTLEDQIVGMRKESDLLEEFVTQFRNWEG
jgi:transcriptional regulator with XRE-family HTH domain